MEKNHLQYIDHTDISIDFNTSFVAQHNKYNKDCGSVFYFFRLRVILESHNPYFHSQIWDGNKFTSKIYSLCQTEIHWKYSCLYCLLIHSIDWMKSFRMFFLVDVQKSVQFLLCTHTIENKTRYLNIECVVKKRKYYCWSTSVTMNVNRKK